VEEEIEPPPEPEVYRWTLSDSIWVPRMFESESKDYYNKKRVKESSFKKDWRHCLEKETLVQFMRRVSQAKPGSKLEDVELIIRKYHPQIVNVFLHFAALSTGDRFAMQLNAFTALVKELQIPDETSPHCNFAALDTMFVATNFERKKENSDTLRKVNPDRALMRFEFVEILLRIAIAKFVKTRWTRSISTAFERLWVEHITPNVAFDLNTDGNEYRRDELYIEAVDEVLRSCYNLLKLIHMTCSSIRELKAKGKRGRSTTVYRMTMDDWLAVLTNFLHPEPVKVGR
jgi:hypothetical protein